MNYYGTQLFPFIELEIDKSNRIPFLWRKRKCCRTTY